VPYKLSGNWLKRKYPGFVPLLRETFEPGAYGIVNFTNYYYPNSYKFNKFIHNLVELAGILKEKYKVDLFDAYAAASKKAASIAQKLTAGNAARNRPYVKDKYAFKQLSVLPQLRRVLKTKLSGSERGMVKSFIFENIFLR